MLAPIIAAANVILENTKRHFRITRTLLLYRLIQYCCLPLVVLFLLARLISRPRYWKKFAERLGFLPRPFCRTAQGCIWLHAVSVGEVASAVPLIRALRERHAGTPVFLSTSTVAGRATAQRQAGPLVDGIFYAPIDYASCVRRTIRGIRPALLIVIETEIWPNLYAEVKRAGAGLACVNARISDRTWPRYRRAKRFLAEVLALPDLVLTQSELDRRRYAELGVEPARLSVAGNLKYDAAIQIRRPFSLPTWGASHIWIAASTTGPNERGSAVPHEVDEDDLVISAFRELAPRFPGLLLILAPRQPARFNAVSRKLQRAGLSFVCRTQLEPETPPLQLPGVLLLDTIGELASAYTHANVVFVGGSLAPRGGHNILEPAAAGVPVIVGPHMHNFQALLNDFSAASALLQIGSAEELEPAVRNLLLDPEGAAILGLRGRTVLEQFQGVALRIAEQLSPLLHGAFWRRPRNIFASAILGPLSQLWTAGGHWKRQRGERETLRQEPLPVPVISIGGITMGGSGKTPFCDYLAAEFRKRGASPAILTRGYHRLSPANTVLLSPAAHVPTALTGDEAQIFLRSGQAAVAIATRRYTAAQTLLAENSDANLLLLDDGFQHASMRRDCDVVLIDGLDPFGGDEVFPNGRLREPLAALARADIFVLTRPGHPERVAAIRKRLAACNPSAPVFTAALVGRVWRQFPSGRCQTVPKHSRVAAFCGLGNPQSFWNTLLELEMDVPFQWTFGDHHQYKPVELHRLVHQARAHCAEFLVTTEKDFINLPPDAESILCGMPLLWLKIELALSEPEAFFSYAQKVIASKTDHM